MSILHKLLITFLGIIVAISALLTTVFYIFSKQAIDNNIKEHVSEQFHSIGSYFRSNLREHLLKDLRILVSNPSVDGYLASTESEKKMNARALEKLFSQTINYTSSYDSIYFVDFLGQEKVRVERTGRVREYRRLENSRLFKRLESGPAGAVVVEGPVWDMTHGPFFSIGMAKTDPDVGEFGGAVVIDYSLGNFFEYLSRMRIPAENSVWVFSPDGTVLKRPLSPKTVFDPQAYLSPSLQREPVLNTLDEGLLVHQDLSILDETPLLRVAVGIPFSVLMEDIRSAMWFFGMVFLVSVLITSLLVARVSDYFSKPVIELARAADSLAKGRLPEPVETRATGEVKMLVDSFNRMAEDLRETTVSKDYMNNIFKSMVDTMMIVTPDGTIRNANAASCALLGCGEERLVGMSFDGILDGECSFEKTILEEMREHGRVGNKEVIYRSLDGRKIPMLLSASPMKDRDGYIEGIVCAAQDVTERKKTEEKLARLGMAVEQAGESIMITDARGTIQYVNPAFEQISGYTRTEVIGQSPEILSSGQHDPDYYQTIRNTLAQGNVWSGTLINRNKQGNLFVEAAVISPVRDTTGRIVSFVAVKRDVTHEMEMEEQLRHSQKMEAVGKLAGGIAHDFNNLLMAIIGYSEIILCNLPESDPVRHDVEEIRKAGDRASGLTRQLLAFSRKQVCQPKVVDLNAVVEGMDGMLRRLIGEDVLFRTCLGENLGNVRIDPGQFEQVLANLVVNARDAMPGGGKITVETSNVVLDGDYVKTHVVVRPGPYVLVAVSDTGCGIDDKTKARIFEPFFTTKEPGKGSGLGLSTVYGIVKQNKGYIWVYSEPGVGTTFRVYFPMVTEGVEHVFVRQEEETLQSNGRETILVAEDEELVRDLVTESLRANGYTVLEANDGAEAVRISEVHPAPIQLLVTDVVMPSMNGREVAERVRGMRPQIKVIFMSGYTENAIVHHGILDSGTVLLQKPFRPSMLARKIREVLNSPQPS